MPFVGAAGLMGPEHAHFRGGSITSRSYKKIIPLLQTFYAVVFGDKYVWPYLTNKQNYMFYRNFIANKLFPAPYCNRYVNTTTVF
jgi:hypothetical protein